MPILIVRSLEYENNRCLLGIDFLKNPYPQFTKNKMGIRCFLNRVFTENGKVTLQPKKTFVFNIYKPRTKNSSAKLDVSSFTSSQGVPKGSWIEILVTNFVFTEKDQNGEKRVTEVPICPKEMKLEIISFAPSSLHEQIKNENEALSKIGSSFETIGSLHEAGFHEIAGDLTQALLRMENNDYEGALKFFRKVIEAFKKHMQKSEIETIGANRIDLMKRFLGATYSLFSNFGEHARTYGWVAEATLAKEITIPTIRYILSLQK